MKRLPLIVWVSMLVGGGLTGLLIVSWIEYLWGDGDGDRVAFCTVVGVFAVPLFAGSVLILARQRSGLRFLRFGCALFIFDPGAWPSILELGQDRELAEYLSGGNPHR
ncbi:MAG: hypothetical protein U0792_06875 [Gemmataceae bacterium]